MVISIREKKVQGKEDESSEGECGYCSRLWSGQETPHLGLPRRVSCPFMVVIHICSCVHFLADSIKTFED